MLKCNFVVLAATIVKQSLISGVVISDDGWLANKQDDAGHVCVILLL